MNSKLLDSLPTAEISKPLIGYYSGNLLLSRVADNSAMSQQLERIGGSILDNAEKYRAVALLSEKQPFSGNEYDLVWQDHILTHIRTIFKDIRIWSSFDGPFHDQLLESQETPLFQSYSSAQFDKRNKTSPYDIYRQKIFTFGNLPKGWNSYDADAPSEKAITLATRFVDLAEKYALKIDWLAPTADDSIMIALITKSSRQEWEFYSSGETAVMFQNPSEEKEYIDLDEANFESLLTR